MNANRITVVSLFVTCVLATTAVRAAEPKTSPAEIEKIRAELKPLRERASEEPEVVAARAALDAAYRAYWSAVRAAMLRLDPASRDLIERDITHRQSLPALRPPTSPGQ